ncbi:MAG TPA: GNAT family N-acetyltransferase [Isosphaeraceae bacterium]|jgi:predicted acetyltransferase
MKVSIHEAGPGDAPTIANLLQLYLHDFTEFDGHDADDSGRFAYDDLAPYWTEPDRRAFLIRADGRLAGFVLVDREAPLSGPGACWSIAEFFVMRKYRRRGIGARAAAEVFRRLPGRWEVSQIAANTPAQVFWRAAIARCTGGRYTETFVEGDDCRGPVQSFTIESPAPG